MENYEPIHCHAKGLLEAMEKNEDIAQGKVPRFHPWMEIMQVLKEIVSYTESQLKAKSKAQEDESATQDAAALQRHNDNQQKTAESG